MLLALIEGMQALIRNGLQRVAGAVASLAQETGLPEEIGIGSKHGVVIVLPAEHYGIAHENGVGKPSLRLRLGKPAEIERHCVKPKHLPLRKLRHLGNGRRFGLNRRLRLNGSLRFDRGLGNFGGLSRFFGDNGSLGILTRLYIYYHVILSAARKAAGKKYSGDENA